MVKVVFWVSVSLIIYTYIVYPLILVILSRVSSKFVNKKEYFPVVSIIISVYNEERHIESKINNCLELEYPEDKLEIIIGSDGSTDRTNEIVQRYASEFNRIKFYKWKERRGKPSVLNDLVLHAKGEVIVFTDARQIFERNAIKELVSNFSDEKIGCVSGELILIKGGEEDSGEGIGLYWEYEKFLRKKESEIYSMIGATGAIYAIKKDLYTPPPPDTILDDCYIPLKVVQHGYRAIFEPGAKAYDRVASTHVEEYKRKVRTLAGNWQMFIEFKDIFNPLKSKIAIQFFSHKFLRVIVPFLLISVFISNIFLLENSFYRIILVSQIVFYSIAILRWKFLRKIKIFDFPYTFCVLNIAAVEGLFRFLNGTQKVTWER